MPFDTIGRSQKRIKHLSTELDYQDNFPSYDYQALVKASLDDISCMNNENLEKVTILINLPLF